MIIKTNMLRLIVLILGTLASIAILKFRVSIRDFFGDVAFAEKYFGSGGTYTLIIILGLLTFVFSLMYATGTFQSLFVSLAGRLFGSL